MSAPIVVVGGGFAGIAAACRLAGDGHRVVLLERSPRLGGRAASFRDPASGETIDFGHHVSMRCCTATDGFLRRIGAGDAIAYQPELSVPILYDGGRTVLRGAPALPGPMHLVPGLLRYRALSFADRFRVLRAGAAILVDRRRGHSFGDWLRAHGQSPRAIVRLWDPVCVATLNAHVEDVDLQAARKVFREGFFFPDGAGLGLFTQPMSTVFDAARDYLEARDGEVRIECSVQQIYVRDGRVTEVEFADGDRLEAEAVVAAILPWDLASIASEPELASIHEAAAELKWAPIVNVHLWFDRPILDEDFVIGVDRPVQAVFDLTRIHGSYTSSTPGEDRSADRSSPKQLRPSDGVAVATHLVLSQSAASEWVDRSPDEVVAELHADLVRLLPNVGPARLERHLEITHRRATFIPAPGSDTRRPPSKTPINGLYLAGDWTATGWPSTIEGAIRSGVVAAARVEVDLETA